MTLVRIGILGFAVLLPLHSFAHGSPVSSSSRVAHFCDFDSKDSKDRITLDFKRHTESAPDSGSSFRILKANRAVGIDSSLPLSLPTVPISPREGRRTWKLGAYEYSAFMPNPLDPDWILISVRPLDNGTFGKLNIQGAITILYSRTSGVLLIRRLTIIDGVKIQAELRACGEEKIFPWWFY